MAYNLDVDGVENINIDNIQGAKLLITTSNAHAPKEYPLTIKKKDDGSIEYYILDSGSLVVDELITPTVGGGDIYFPGDEIADVEISYAEPYLQITNLNFKEPEAVTITVLTETGEKISTPFISAKVGEKTVLLFNATNSVAVPDLTVVWANGTEFTAEELSESVVSAADDISTDEKELFRTKKLEWTPTVDGANVLLVKGTLGDKKTTKRYVIAVGNVVYELKEKNLPMLSVKKGPGGSADVTLTFSDKELMQPFSLPCGALALDGKNSLIPVEMQSKIDAILSYTTSSSSVGAVGQWKKNVPSDFNEVEKNKGYFLQRKAEVKGDLVLSVKCAVNPLAPPDSNSNIQPKLVKSWNLIGISGYEPVAVDKLTLPPYKKILLAYSLTNDGLDDGAEVTELLPGRVYWVKVG